MAYDHRHGRKFDAHDRRATTTTMDRAASSTTDKLSRLWNETLGVRDELDRLYLRMDARGDAAAEFTKPVKRIHGEVAQLAERIRQIQQQEAAKGKR